MSFHVLTGSFVHESSTFKKGETTLQDFRDEVLDLGQTAIDRFGDVNDELAGFLDAGRASITHSVSAHANPGAPVSRQAFDHIAGIICDAAAAQRKRWTVSSFACTARWSPASARTARASFSAACAPSSGLTHAPTFHLLVVAARARRA